MHAVGGTHTHTTRDTRHVVRHVHGQVIHAGVQAGAKDACNADVGTVGITAAATFCMKGKDPIRSKGDNQAEHGPRIRLRSVMGGAGIPSSGLLSTIACTAQCVSFPPIIINFHCQLSLKAHGDLRRIVCVSRSSRSE